ncbi:MAG: hypothetical protein ACXADB_06720 [Candidatus Hermodarchaeia archaeon]
MMVVEAQDISSPWNRTYGGSESDGGYSLVEVSTGGFACTGYTMSSGAGLQDVWLVRTGVDGLAQWSQTYGGAESDWGRTVLEVSGGGFAIAGDTFSYGNGSLDVWLLRTTSDGTLLWNKTYGGLLSDAATSMVGVSTGGFAIAGYTSNFGAASTDFWLLRTDADGNHLWNHTYGGVSIEEGYSVVEVSTGGFAIAGYTNSYGAGSSDVWLVRTDANGNLLWSRTYGDNGFDRGHSVVELSTGGFAITGYTNSYGAGNYDVWLLRTAADGTLLWNQTYGGSAIEYGQSVLETHPGGLTIACYSSSFGVGDNDVWLLRTDLDGTLLWNQTFGGTGEDRAIEIIRVSSGGFAIIGDTTSYDAGLGDFWLLRITEPGPFLPGLPIDPLLLVLVIIIIVIVVVVIVILRRRRGKPKPRKRKSKK